jgi:hypothetical protein
MTLVRRAPAWLALAGLVVALHVAPARAVERTAAPAGIGTLLKYVGCALAVARASEGLGLATAAAVCARILYEELERGVA